MKQGPQQTARPGLRSAREGWRRLWPWLLGAAPALVTLVLIRRFTSPLPVADSWHFLLQYRDWTLGQYGVADLLAPHNEHPSTVGKLLFWAVMEWLDGDLELLPLVSWLISSVISAAVLVLLLRLEGLRRDRVPLYWGLANLLVFTLTQGNAWLWEFVFMNYIPGGCLAAGLVVLRREAFTWTAWAGAMLLGLVAANGCGTGALVWLLLLPLLLMQKPAGAASRRLAIGGWVLLQLAFLWLAFNGFGLSEGVGGRVSFSDRLGRIGEDFWHTVRHWLTLVGFTLGQGTAVDPVTASRVAGTVLLGLGAAAALAGARLFRHLPDHRLRHGILSFGAFALYGAGSAVLISLGRMGQSPTTAMHPRYGTFTLFFPLGVLGLCLIVWQHRDRLSPAWARRAAALGPVLLGAFIALQAAAWVAGGKALAYWHRYYRQDQAVAHFAGRVPVGHTALAHHAQGRLEEVLAFLESRDRLHTVRRHPGQTLEGLTVRSMLSEQRGEANLFRKAGGDGWRVSGRVRLPGSELPPDAVLIVAGGVEPSPGDRLVGLAIPTLPEDFFASLQWRKSYPEHYYGFSLDLEPGAVGDGASGPVRLRAYGFELDSRRIYPFGGDLVPAP